MEEDYLPVEDSLLLHVSTTIVVQPGDVPDWYAELYAQKSGIDLGLLLGVSNQESFLMRVAWESYYRTSVASSLINSCDQIIYQQQQVVTAQQEKELETSH